MRKSLDVNITKSPEQLLNGGVIQSFSDVQRDISGLTTSLSAASLENAQSNKRCSHLQDELQTITDAFEGNIKTLQSENQRLEMENLELETELRKRKTLLEKIRPLFEEACKSTLSDEIDVKYFQDVYGISDEYIERTKTKYESERIDDIVKHIVERFPELGKLNTNNEFLRRVLWVQSEVAELLQQEDDGKVRFEELMKLKRELNEMTVEETKQQAEDAAKLTDLAEQKERLLKHKKKLMQSFV